MFHPFASSYDNLDMAKIYSQHERKKKAEYGECILQIERGSFTPLVFFTTGGMGRESTTFYQRLAAMISQKWDEPYSHTLGWLRCQLGFCLLRACLLCIRGSRGANHREASSRKEAISVTVATSRLEVR